MDRRVVLDRKRSDSRYILLKNIHDIFIANNLPYFIIGGTLLGAVRHRGIVPHDDDDDIAIFDDHIDIFKNEVLPKLMEKNYRVGGVLSSNNAFIPINATNLEILKQDKKHYTYYIGSPDSENGCDIFVMTRRKSDPSILGYADEGWESAVTGGGKCYFEYRYLFPLVPYLFGNYFLYGPYNGIPHLNSCYGNDWNHSSRTSIHINRYGFQRSNFVPITQEITGEDYLTLAPPDITKDLQCLGMLYTDNVNVFPFHEDGKGSISKQRRKSKSKQKRRKSKSKQKRRKSKSKQKRRKSKSKQRRKSKISKRRRS